MWRRVPSNSDVERVVGNTTSMVGRAEPLTPVVYRTISTSASATENAVLLSAVLLAVRFAVTVAPSATSSLVDESMKCAAAPTNGLRLNPDKTRLVDMTQPKAYFEFLGYKFYRTTQNRLRWFARPKSKKKLRSKIRPLTKRCNGHSMEEIIRKLNPILRGWFEYFKHSLSSDFRQVDGWVRMRLRSILRKRHKCRGRGRGSDHKRWPNAYFWELGLFSLVTARDSLRSSASR